ncbi:hypothetical protein AK88_05614 [Plasmodium fragile]|uniref:Schizont-infected cell agglutination C-terminal domain-containing protein n=1 Tax=Plasmodium fragile TaxID=5857 RepID=A0A0D9QCP9_PLAFR|nr:uncharacterized protein AK88_05614 [Plasmodium fragile]KJP84754.1 hypothetical protein AK88_05614 [Plasmodium fragile]
MLYLQEHFWKNVEAVWKTFREFMEKTVDSGTPTIMCAAGQNGEDGKQWNVADKGLCELAFTALRFKHGINLNGAPISQDGMDEEAKKIDNYMRCILVNIFMKKIMGMKCLKGPGAQFAFNLVHGEIKNVFQRELGNIACEEVDAGKGGDRDRGKSAQDRDLWEVMQRWNENNRQNTGDGDWGVLGDGCRVETGSKARVGHGDDSTALKEKVQAEIKNVDHDLGQKVPEIIQAVKTCTEGDKDCVKNLLKAKKAAADANSDNTGTQSPSNVHTGKEHGQSNGPGASDTSGANSAPRPGAQPAPAKPAPAKPAPAKPAPAKPPGDTNTGSGGTKPAKPVAAKPLAKKPAAGEDCPWQSILEGKSRHVHVLQYYDTATLETMKTVLQQFTDYMEDKKDMMDAYGENCHNSGWDDFGDAHQYKGQTVADVVRCRLMTLALFFANQEGKHGNSEKAQKTDDDKLYEKFRCEVANVFGYMLKNQYCKKEGWKRGVEYAWKTMKNMGDETLGHGALTGPVMDGTCTQCGYKGSRTTPAIINGHIAEWFVDQGIMGDIATIEHQMPCDQNWKKYKGEKGVTDKDPDISKKLPEVKQTEAQVRTETKKAVEKVKAIVERKIKDLATKEKNKKAEGESNGKKTEGNSENRDEKQHDKADQTKTPEASSPSGGAGRSDGSAATDVVLPVPAPVPQPPPAAPPKATGAGDTQSTKEGKGTQDSSDPDCGKTEFTSKSEYDPNHVGTTVSFASAPSSPTCSKGSVPGKDPSQETTATGLDASAASASDPPPSPQAAGVPPQTGQYPDVPKETTTYQIPPTGEPASGGEKATQSPDGGRPTAPGAPGSPGATGADGTPSTGHQGNDDPPPLNPPKPKPNPNPNQSGSSGILPDGQVPSTSAGGGGAGGSGGGGGGSGISSSSRPGSTGHGTATTGGAGAAPTPATPSVPPGLTWEDVKPYTPAIIPAVVGIGVIAFFLWKYFAYLGQTRRRTYRTVRDVPSPPLDEEILDHLQRGELPPPDYGYTMVRDRQRGRLPAARRRRPPRVHTRTIIELHLEVLNECEATEWDSVKDDYWQIVVEQFTQDWMRDANEYSSSPASSSNHDSPGTNVSSMLDPPTDVNGIHPCPPHDPDPWGCMEHIQLATDPCPPNDADEPDAWCCMETIQLATDRCRPHDPDPWSCMETIQLETGPCPPNYEDPDPWSCMDTIQLDAEQNAHSYPEHATSDCTQWINWIDRNKHILQECTTQPWFNALKSEWKQYLRDHMAADEDNGVYGQREFGAAAILPMKKLRLWRQWIAQQHRQMSIYNAEEWFPHLLNNVEEETESHKGEIPRVEQHLHVDKVMAAQQRLRLRDVPCTKLHKQPHMKKPLTAKTWIMILALVIEQCELERSLQEKELYVDDLLQQL